MQRSEALLEYLKLLFSSRRRHCGFGFRKISDVGVGVVVRLRPCADGVGVVDRGDNGYRAGRASVYVTESERHLLQAGDRQVSDWSMTNFNQKHLLVGPEVVVVDQDVVMRTEDNGQSNQNFTSWGYLRAARSKETEK